MAARLTKTQARRVLELDDAAEVTRDAVRAAFRKLALRVHPDKNPGYASVCVCVCALSNSPTRTSHVNSHLVCPAATRRRRSGSGR
jgi:hypothetical protein